MSAQGHLLGLAIGPVQPFIEAARRTRDLWYGSTILSDVGKAAARALHEAGADLVFPSPADPENDLDPDSDFIAANRIIVYCQGVDLARAKELLQLGKDAATAYWNKLAMDQKVKLYGVDPNAVDHARWTEQIGDMLELYGACKGVTDMGEFGKARERLDDLLASRKNTRNFEQTKGNWKGVRKSSLDGAREDVLVSRSVRVRQYLVAERDEALDATAIVKRVGGRETKFTPLTRIAADEWIAALKEPARATLCSEYERLVPQLGTKVTGNDGAYRDFPYDGQWLYRGRLEKALYDSGKYPQEAEAHAALKRFHGIMKGVWADHYEPSPYVAMLMADGDQMGSIIARTVPKRDETLLSAQQRLSRALADFAREVPKIARRHQGHAVYAGGDDALAMLPATRAVACARELERCFADRLKDFGDHDTRGTLSVGIAIRHVLDPLGTLRRDAARAKKIAKDGKEGENSRVVKKRNALAILLAPRSGAQIVARGRWAEEADIRVLDERLARWGEAFRDGLLSSAAVYDLQQVARSVKGEIDLSRREAQRVLARKGDWASGESLALKEVLDAVIESEGVEAAVTELLIARRLAGLKR